MKNYENFIKEAGLNPEDFSSAWAFGNSKEMADELAQLVLTGKKTATASALADYEEGEALPTVDNKFEIILNGDGQAVAAIRTSKVYIVKFNQVSAEHAYKEGEGDRSLAYWRTVHEKFWRGFGLFSPEMEVVCEEFELLYPRNFRTI